MKTKYILLFSISILCASFSMTAQETTETTTDTTKVAIQKYGLRVGGDLSKLARTAFEDGYSGFEIVGDLRFSKKFYAAAELGTETRDWDEDNLKATISGSYVKLGADYNAYNNWIGMNNAITAGLRYGFATFSEELTAYPIYTTDITFPTEIRTDPIDFSGLNASWIEFILGVKTEIFTNLYLGINVQVKRMISEKTPDNFGNLIVPGFNRTYDFSKFGVGYGYSLSYLIPIFKK
ncbi:MAG TPA: hypothetical protein DCS66_06905 [Flavobacteriaceae bacterium]|nr:hypothetical protein [Flavobacteriaceae bacterium]HAT64316.1 hypothetical protein [Flavobacteriaceae bacterium]